MGVRTWKNTESRCRGAAPLGDNLKPVDNIVENSPSAGARSGSRSSFF
jgi:hypothetical protein